ncbi:MAG: HD-GYP domain-containing protein [Simplicispira sp.]|nr:HD-GYP domain-containing protein [Simplicispira sp.]
MLKRIHTRDLVLGMYVQEFCGSWMDHPFWRAKFLLKDASDLARIRATSITELWIDTERGLDVPAGTATLTREEVEARIDTDFSDLAAVHAMESAAAAAAAAASAPAPRRHAPTGMQEELRAAASICSQGRAAVLSMFHEARMGRAVDAEQAQDLVREIDDSVTRNPGALISLARLKTADDYTYLHSVAVCALMVALARQLGLSDVHTRGAGLAGLLHDLGKAAIPIEVLNKPGKLTDDEFAVVRGHPRAGYELLKEAGQVGAPVLDACLHHHEKMDGSGYPDRLGGDQISLIARMAAVCDVYDAVTSDRPYKRGWDPSESLRRMAEWTGSHFDPRVFQAFIKRIGIYPVGSLVRLASGRLAVVTEQGSRSLVTPRVLAFYSLRSGLRIPPQTLDLGAPACQDRIAAREDPAKWNFPDLHAMWTGLPGHAPG